MRGLAERKSESIADIVGGSTATSLTTHVYHVSDLSVRHARAEEMQAADAMIDAVVSKRCEPKGAYKGYAVVDLRSTTQQGKQH